MKHLLEYLEFNKDQADQCRSIFEANKKKLEVYLDGLLWWNQKINLISRNVSRETLRKHLLHSLTITQSIPFQEAIEIIDTGTGGGLPGIPLAITNPGKKFVLNDIVSKKVLACKAMISEFSLKNVRVETGSVEHLQLHGGVLISKHAFKVNELLQLVNEKEWTHMLFLKGREEVQGELGGIKEALSIKVLDLYSGFEDVFFEGKALVEISRR